MDNYRAVLAAFLCHFQDMKLMKQDSWRLCAWHRGCRFKASNIHSVNLLNLHEQIPSALPISAGLLTILARKKHTSMRHPGIFQPAACQILPSMVITLSATACCCFFSSCSFKTTFLSISWSEIDWSGTSHEWICEDCQKKRHFFISSLIFASVPDHSSSPWENSSSDSSAWHRAQIVGVLRNTQSKLRNSKCQDLPCSVSLPSPPERQAEQNFNAKTCNRINRTIRIRRIHFVLKDFDSLFCGFGFCFFPTCFLTSLFQRPVHLERFAVCTSFWLEFGMYFPYGMHDSMFDRGVYV